MAKRLWISTLALAAICATAGGPAEAAIRKFPGKQAGEASPTPDPARARRLAVKIAMNGLDDESPFSNVRTNQTFDAVFFLSPASPSETKTFTKKWGGELCADLTITVKLNPDDTVSLSGDAKLFEGTDESRSDLDGEKSFSYVLYPPTHPQAMVTPGPTPPPIKVGSIVIPYPEPEGPFRKIILVPNTEEVSHDRATWVLNFDYQP